MMRRSIVLASLFSLLVIVVLTGIYVTRQGASPAAQPAPKPQPVAVPQAAPTWPKWGGASGSASASGENFFDKIQARAFAAGVAADQRKYVIELNARSMLPVAEAAFDEILPDNARTLYLQFHDHPTDAQRAALTAQGVELLAYVGGYAWTARGERAALQGAMRLASVRGASRIDPRDKLNAFLFRGYLPHYARTADGRAHLMMIGAPGTQTDVIVQALAADPATAGAEVRMGLPSVSGPRFEIIAATDISRQLAALDNAAYVGYPAPPAASRDGITDEQSNVIDVRDNAPNLTGAGVSVAVREIGKPVAHVDFAARLQYVDTDGSSGPSDVSHGTAVAGQIGSDGTAQPGAKGTAPGAALLVYGVSGDPNETFGTQDILNAVNRGARISNHSYGPVANPGEELFGNYNDISADWDNAIRSRDLIGFFAGNEENDAVFFNHIDFFVGAKNTICIGATDKRAHAGDTNPAFVPKTDGIASFSKYGPMDDGRVKPDLVAFGDSVVVDQGTNGMRFASGTSFATPAAAGIAALCTQHYRTIFGTEPTGPMIKALLCNTATDLGSTGPDATYGFGLINAEAAVTLLSTRTSAISSPLLPGTVSNNEVRGFSVDVQNNFPQLKVTLCWFDVAAVPNAAKALVNDLDLELIAPDGTLFYPFKLDISNPSAAATSSGANTIDPIEQIIIDLPVNGPWRIQVKGTSVPQGPQNFALCINKPSDAPSLAALIIASPESGPAPLAVSFSAEQSIGTITNYAWDFGDGKNVSGADLVRVDHTYAAPGTYSVKLTVNDVTTDSKTIEVTKQEREAFPSKARFKLTFKVPDDNLSLPDDAISFAFVSKDLERTPQGARDAIAAGEYEGKTYFIRVGGIEVAEVLLDRKGGFKSKTVAFKLNFKRGEMSVAIKKKPLEDALDNADMNRDAAPKVITIHTMPVEIETTDMIYRSSYIMEYKNSGRAGSAKKKK